jgi:hypothetical protein
MTWKEIEEKARFLMENNQWRLGQSLFRVIDFNYPEISKKIRELGLSCFYKDNKIEAFKKKVLELMVEEENGK